MDIDTFLALSKQSKFNLVHLRDWKTADYLKDIHSKRVQFSSEIELFDHLWSAEHLEDLLDSCIHSISRLHHGYDSKSDPAKLKLTAKFVLETLDFVDKQMKQLGLEPLIELNWDSAHPNSLLNNS